MRVLVTGAGGFIGSHAARAFAERGAQVSGVVRSHTRATRLRQNAGSIDRIECDLDDELSVSQMIGEVRPEIVVHPAWYTEPADYRSSPRNVQSLLATRTLVRALERSACRRFVALGTCLEYADADHRRMERDRLAPSSLYACCKVASAEIADAICGRAGIEFTWARLFHLHGPDEHPQRILPAVVRALLAGTTVPLSPGEQVRDHLHVDDVARALVHLALVAEPGIYNICSGCPVTLKDLLVKVATIVGRPDLLQFGRRPYAADEMMFLAGDASRLLGTGWSPSRDLHSGLEDVVTQLRAAAC